MKPVFLLFLFFIPFVEAAGFGITPITLEFTESSYFYIINGNDPTTFTVHVPSNIVVEPQKIKVEGNEMVKISVYANSPGEGIIEILFGDDLLVPGMLLPFTVVEEIQGISFEEGKGIRGLYGIILINFIGLVLILLQWKKKRSS